MRGQQFPRSGDRLFERGIFTENTCFCCHGLSFNRAEEAIGLPHANALSIENRTDGLCIRSLQRDGFYFLFFAALAAFFSLGVMAGFFFTSFFESCDFPMMNLRI